MYHRMLVGRYNVGSPTKLDFIDIIHTQIIIFVTNRKPLSEHQKSCHSQTFLSCPSIFCITAKIYQKLLMVDEFHWCSGCKSWNICRKRSKVGYLLSIVLVFSKNPIVASFICITETSFSILAQYNGSHLH